ncbi:MAG: hypothetical protein BGO43_14040 [Gammaproteobacteria bacterium 39-13]|nr:response regulator [Gammaproteobacteria bacterium]OJV89810.1 MAG: hypothetical protein BGO43_14040 [Gammaproteobacteria bacterium 39-13]
MDRKILVIDDEINNLEIIEEFIKLSPELNHKIIKCQNGQEGLDALIEEQHHIDVVLLDRMMPIMDGVDFLKKMSAHPELKKIPVIMQTASTEKEHLLEGFQLGVYHYLVKPYSPSVLNSIVKAAVDFYTKQRELSAEVNNSKTLFKYVDQAVFKIKNLEDVDMISVSLARLFPNPDKVVLGISEMLINAVEHGNLGITYEEKTDLNMHCKWREEIEKRLNLPENSNKSVTVSYMKKNNEIIINIKDEGKGFDYIKYLDYDPARSTHNHGRGIAFANSLSFDRVEYVGVGNEVNCSVFSGPQH